MEFVKGDIEGLNEGFLKRLNHLGQTKGEIVNVTSGYRSLEEQRILWEKSDKSGKWVAPVGKSRHNYGLAIDVGNQLYKNMGNNELEKFGLYKPMSYENWHIEPVETKGKVGEQMKTIKVDGLGGNISTNEYGIATGKSGFFSYLSRKKENSNDATFSDEEAGGYAILKQVDEMISFKSSEEAGAIEFVVQNGKSIISRTIIIILGLVCLYIVFLT